MTLNSKQAEADARVATKMAPGWPKPLHRLAQALQVTLTPLMHQMRIHGLHQEKIHHAMRNMPCMLPASCCVHHMCNTMVCTATLLHHQNIALNVCR